MSRLVFWGTQVMCLTLQLRLPTFCGCFDPWSVVVHAEALLAPFVWGPLCNVKCMHVPRRSRGRSDGRGPATPARRGASSRQTGCGLLFAVCLLCHLFVGYSPTTNCSYTKCVVLLLYGLRHAGQGCAHKKQCGFRTHTQSSATMQVLSDAADKSLNMKHFSNN